MLFVVAPVLHNQDASSLEVNVTLPPSQKVVDPLGVMSGVAGFGSASTLVTAEETDEHPAALLTVTLKLPVLFTTMLCIVSPLFHKYDAAALEVNVTLPPSQNVVGPPGVIVGVAGNGFTVTTVAAVVAVQLSALVTVTV